MNGKVIFVDQEKCTGCRQCEMVCSVFHTGASNPARSRIKVIKWENVGFYLPTTCMNCEKPLCVEVCPTHACHKEPDRQRVVIDKDTCIGCKACIIACPFGAPLFDGVERVSVKCDYCDGDPQCASFCEARAVSYVEAENVALKKKRENALKLSELAQRGM